MQHRLVLALCHIKCGTEQAAEGSRSKKTVVMAVNFIAKAGIALGVEAFHSFQINRGRVWKNDSVPNHLNARLSVADA